MKRMPLSHPPPPPPPPHPRLLPSSSSSSSQLTPHLRLPRYRRLLLHTLPPRGLAAVNTSWLGAGPPPDAPTPRNPDREEQQWWIARRQRHMEALRSAVESRRRFWKEVSVRLVPVEPSQSSSSSPSSPSPPPKDNNARKELVVHLDARPLRHPTTKHPIPIPPTKPVLASALALEWDALLASTHGMTKGHLVPLTSLVCRALDIRAADERDSGSIRREIVRSVLRYLDTDALLCWEPEPVDTMGLGGTGAGAGATGRDSVEQRELRSRQIAAFETISRGLLADGAAWARMGVSSLRSVLDAGSLFPRGQDPGVREAIGAWVGRLDAWELAGLERAVLAGKSLVAAARLVVDWTEGDAGRGPEDQEEGRKDGGRKDVKRITPEEVARATSVEVDWQIGQWGEVQDSHDVEREDLRRQLGSVVLLVSGTGA